VNKKHLEDCIEKQNLFANPSSQDQEESRDGVIGWDVCTQKTIADPWSIEQKFTIKQPKQENGKEIKVSGGAYTAEART